MHKRSRALGIAVVFLIILSSCTTGQGQPSPTTTIPAAASATAAIEDERLDQISVTMKPDTTLKQAIVTVENQSSYTFTGDIHVRLKDSSKKEVGYDMIIIEELTAGNSTFARIDVSSTQGMSMEYSFAQDYVFEEGNPSSGGTLDEVVSQNLSDEIYGSFGGGDGGIPTSWYDYIVKIEVFSSDAGNYATATVNTTDKEGIDRIGNMIFAEYRKDYNLGKVLVLDDSGNTVFEREN